MAQAIHCDGPGESHLADMIVSRVDNGDTTAWCFAHYVDVCRAIAESADEAVREQTDAEAAARLAAVEAPDTDEPAEPIEPEASADVITGEYGTPPITSLPEARDVTPAEPEAVADALAVAQVIRRGTSQSRKAHEARKRAKDSGLIDAMAAEAIRELEAAESTSEAVPEPTPAP